MDTMRWFFGQPLISEAALAALVAVGVAVMVAREWGRGRADRRARRGDWRPDHV